MCDINQSTSKKQRHMLDLSTDALLHEIHPRVLVVKRYQGSACVDP